jgi:hypothetical protein
MKTADVSALQVLRRARDRMLAERGVQLTQPPAERPAG